MIEGRIHEFIINFYFIDDMCVLYIDALLALAHTAHVPQVPVVQCVVQGLVCTHAHLLWY